MDYTKFTPAFKDGVLKNLCDRCDPYRQVYLDWRLIAEDPVLLNACLNQFKELKLIAAFSFNRATGSLSVILTADAFDLIAGGGFVFIADRYLKDLEKANLELEKLKAKPGLKKYVEQISGVSGILSDLISAVVAIRG